MERLQPARCTEERVGFEPTEGSAPSAVFKTAALSQLGHLSGTRKPFIHTGLRRIAPNRTGRKGHLMAFLPTGFDFPLCRSEEALSQSWTADRPSLPPNEQTDAEREDRVAQRANPRRGSLRGRAPVLELQQRPTRFGARYLTPREFVHRLKTTQSSQFSAA